MNVLRSTSSASALLVGATLLAPLVGLGTAEAGTILTKSKESGSVKTFEYRSSLDQDDLTEVTATVSSEAGDEEFVFVETDAWLHGAATLAETPSENATVSLTLYDTGSAALISFSGALVGGSITFTADSVVTCDSRSKLECSSQKPVDVEVLAAELYPAAKAHELTLDLSGADAYAVAYAEVVVTEPWVVTDACLKDASGTLCGDTDHLRTVAEVGWDAVGSVWEADAGLEHTGVIGVKAKAFGMDGEAVDNVHAELGATWLDDGGGVSTLAVDARTGLRPPRLAMLCGSKERRVGSPGCAGLPVIGIVSEGWTADTSPTHADLEVAGGTVAIPANSYQRIRKQPELLYQAWDDTIQDYLNELVLDPGSTISISSGSFELEGVSAADLADPVCSSGTCVVLVESDAGHELSVTTYGLEAAALPDKQALSVAFYDKGGEKRASETITVEFDPEVIAVFANEVELGEDPTGLDASGSLSLLGAADSRGRQSTIAKGSFHGSFTRDGDGDLGLGGYGADEAAQADTPFAVLLGGPVECGGGDSGCGGDWAPPVLAYRGRIAAYVVGLHKISTAPKMKGSF